MNIIFIAPPAAGKGTYSHLLKERYGFNHISAGEVLREVEKEGTPLGKEVSEIMARGALVDDSLMARLILDKLNKIDLSIPFIMDGYPRKLNQVKDYERILQKLNLEVTYAIFLDISKETGLKRKLGRATCPIVEKVIT